MLLREVAVTATFLFLVAAVSATPAAAGRPYPPFSAPGTVLREGTPEQAGLNPIPIAIALRQAEAWTSNQPDTGHPLYAGEVTLLARNGIVVATDAAGYALRYADRRGDPLPADRQIPMRTTTIFDVASLSKLFTCIVAMQQIQHGTLGLNAPVARYLPEFATKDKSSITIKQLMTHTSGLPADLRPPLWRYPTMAARINAILHVTPQYPAGSTYLYSDVNMLILQQVLRRITGRTLDVLVRNGITGPLRMHDTMYNPPARLKSAIAAEEYESGPGEPPRGLVWGRVHDETAWALGGVAGNAGLFSTVRDIAVLAQTLLNGGSYAGCRILAEQSVRTMLTDDNQRFPGHSHGLGFELDQPRYMGLLAGPDTAGHTGFTGATLVIDSQSHSMVLQFSNRVHPTRAWGSSDPARRAVADGLAASIVLGDPDTTRT